MSGVDNMLYMYSTNASDGQMKLRVDFDVSTDPSTDQVLAQMRYSQAAVPAAARRRELRASRSRSRSRSPLVAVRRCTRRRARYDPLFLSNYAYININDPMTRVPGVGQVHDLRRRRSTRCASGCKPDTLAKLEHHGQRDHRARMQAQNTVNPAGQIGGEPGAAGAAVHLHGAGAGAAGRRRRSSATSSCAPSRTARMVRREGRGARRARARRTTASTGRLNGKPGRRRRGLPAARLERASTRCARRRS